MVSLRQLTCLASASPPTRPQAGLDWYGTNENSAALFLAGQQLTTSDSEFEDDWGELEDGEAEPRGNGHAHDDAHSGGSGSGGGGEPGAGQGGGGPPGGALYDESALPRAVRARLVEQEAYIAELEDQNLRCVSPASAVGTAGCRAEQSISCWCAWQGGASTSLHVAVPCSHSWPSFLPSPATRLPVVSNLTPCSRDLPPLTPPRRLREQLDMLQQEVEELRGQRHAGDSEEGFAEHSEGSLPADLSVMNHPPQH